MPLLTSQPPFIPPWYLRSGLMMTVYMARGANRHWQDTLTVPPVSYQDRVFQGHQGVPIFGQWACPPGARGTVIATYGITGSLDNQWFLHILGRKAHQRGLAVLLFDWRAHGKTAELSPTLTSDGLYEGYDYLELAAAAKALGCPPPYWFIGYSLGGQLALWGAKAAQDLPTQAGLDSGDVGGVAVVCPSLDPEPSLKALVSSPLGRVIERAIAQSLQELAVDLVAAHPTTIDPAAVARAHSIWTFDQELVIPRLGFPTVEAYYDANRPLPFLDTLTIPTLVVYAADDPLFTPAVLPELRAAAVANPHLDVLLTPQGGHVGYYSSRRGQRLAQDPDPWWAWNRVLDWILQR